MAKADKAAPASGSASGPEKTLAEKIDHLFATVRSDRAEFSREQVAAAIEEAGYPSISATYLWQLRKGVRDNPTKHHLEGLAWFFGVPPSYFFDEQITQEVDLDLEVLVALRDEKVRQLTALAHELSPETLDTILDMVRRARQLEGLGVPGETKPARARKPR